MATLPELLKTTVEMDGSDLHITTNTPPQVRVHGKLQRLPMPDLHGGRHQAAHLQRAHRRAEEALRGDAGARLLVRHPRPRALPVQRVQPAGRGGRRLPPHPRADPVASRSWGCRPSSSSWPSSRAASSWSPGRPAAASRPRWPRCSTRSTASATTTSSRSRTRSSTSTSTRAAWSTSARCTATRRRSARRSAPRCARTRTSCSSARCATSRRSKSALRIAETGHLTFATLHTNSAAQTINRIIDIFPAHQQGQIRTQLSLVLEGIVCQTLLPRADRPGRVVATEILVPTSAIRNLIREDKIHQIYSSMQTGQEKVGDADVQPVAGDARSSAGRSRWTRRISASSHRDELMDMINRGVGVVAGAGLGRVTARPASA